MTINFGVNYSENVRCFVLEIHGIEVVSTSALCDRVLSSRPRLGMGMFGVKTWLSTLETVYLS